MLTFILLLQPLPVLPLAMVSWFSESQGLVLREGRADIEVLHGRY
jgi:hypothetical protein